VKVLIADKFEKSGLYGLAALGCGIVNEPGIGSEKLGAALETAEADILIVRSTKVPKGAIEQGKRLRLIIRAGAGVDNIDVPAATARQVAVCNCPGMNAIAVAELTMGLLLCCDRRIPDQTADLRTGNTWNKKEYSTKSKGLKGLTLGVVGVGAIGQEVIKRSVAFGMNVVAWSRGITQQHAAALNCEFGGTDTPALMALAKRCDAITVHLPATGTTNKLFGAEFFGAMKPGAYFINTSRGSVVDEAALRTAVKEKGLRAGLDVFDGAPAEGNAPWECATAKLPGVYCSHHAGASTDQAQTAVAEETVRIVRVYSQENRFINCVNAEQLEQGKWQGQGVA
jgi:D-3-phosphoglycerate dehydrogenase / 2-oxoglutarate reductase